MNYLVLPSEVSDFEQRYLQRVNRLALIAMLAHLPLFVAVSWINGMGVYSAIGLTSLALAGPILAAKFGFSERSKSIVAGVCLMFLGGLLVHFGQGPAQTEMHFYFFAALATLAVFANPMVIIVAAATAAIHHIILWYFLPTSLLNYEAPFWIILVHALFVILESAVVCIIARSFFDNVIGMERIVIDRTQEIQRQAKETRELLNEMNTEAKVASGEAGELASAATGVKTVVEQFKRNINEISSSASAAASESHSAVKAMYAVNDKIETLNDHSSEIEDMISLVNKIADQTNLLALNATIEAARAGEAGKGFAVVANEVKELARESSCAADAIREKIERIRMGTAEVTEEVSSASKIVSGINDNQDTIARAVVQQSTASSQLLESFADVVRATDGIATSTARIAQASEVAAYCAS